MGINVRIVFKGRKGDGYWSPHYFGYGADQSPLMTGVDRVNAFFPLPTGSIQALSAMSLSQLKSSLVLHGEGTTCPASRKLKNQKHPCMPLYQKL